MHKNTFQIASDPNLTFFIFSVPYTEVGHNAKNLVSSALAHTIAASCELGWAAKSQAETLCK